MTDPKRQPPASEPTLRESKSALLGAAQAAIADRQVKDATPPNPPIRTFGARWGLTVIMAVLGIGAAALLVWRPLWLVGPTLPPETPAVQEASATLALADAISRIRAYAAANGRLPEQPAEAGVTNRSIGLQATGGGEFLVTMPSGGRVITLRSSDSVQAAVVAAIRVLQRRS